MLGRFVGEWRFVHGRYREQITSQRENSDKATKHRQTTEQWLCGLIQAIWEQWFSLWEARNQDLHGHDAKQKQSHLRQEVHRQLRDIYSTKQFMDPKVRSLLLQDPEAHATYPLHVTTNWLRLHTPIFKENVCKVRRMALKGMKSISTYFRPVSNQPPG